MTLINYVRQFLFRTSDDMVRHSEVYDMESKVKSMADLIDSGGGPGGNGLGALTTNTQSGATYTLVLTDAGEVVSMTNASPNTVTVPPNASVAFPVGSRVIVKQEGAGSTTLVGGAGVTINTSESSLQLRGQYAYAGLIKTATNTWEATGSLGSPGGAASGIPATTVDAKGDLIAATADNVVTRLAVGTNGQVLTANSAASTGLDWETPSAGGGTADHWAKLTLPATAGDTVLHVDAVPPRLATFGTAVVVGVGQPDCHLDTATSASSTTITLAHPLVANRLTGDYIWSYNQTEPLPFTYLGGKGGNAITYANRNRLAWNRIMQFGGYWGNVGTVLMLLDGGFAVDDSIFYRIGAHKIMTTMEYAPSGGFYSFGVPYAVGGGDYKSLLRQYDQAGNVATVNNFTADGTCVLDSFFIDCKGESDSIALMHSPQQPGWMRNMRFLSSRGVAAYIYGGQNYWINANNQYDDNMCGLYAFHTPSVIRDINVTSPFPVGGVQYSIRLGARQMNVGGVVLLETVPAPGPLISIEGTNIAVRDLWTSGLTGSDTGVIINVDVPGENPEGQATYYINNAHCDETSTNTKFLRDVQRNASIQAWGPGGDIGDRTLEVVAIGAGIAQYVKRNSGWTTFGGGVPHAA